MKTLEPLISGSRSCRDSVSGDVTTLDPSHTRVSTEHRTNKPGSRVFTFTFTGACLGPAAQVAWCDTYAGGVRTCSAHHR